jgi:hypothetical protein
MRLGLLRPYNKVSNNRKPDQLLSYSELQQTKSWLADANQTRLVDEILLSRPNVPIPKIVDFYRHDWVFASKISKEQQPLFRLTLTRVLYNRFIAGELPITNWNELINFFIFIVGKQQSYIVPLKKDPEYPTVYGETVGERLIEMDQETMRRALQESKIHFFEHLVLAGVPAEIAEVIVFSYSDRLFQLR